MRRWIRLLAIIALVPLSGRAEVVNYSLTIENNTELNLTVFVRQNSDAASRSPVPAPYAHWDLERHRFEVGPVSTVRQTFRVEGRMQIVFTPSRCGNPKAYPELKVETWALPGQTSKYYVLKDGDFGKSSILPQCPERLADSAQCIRAREELARLDALRREPELLTKYGWDLSGQVTLPGSTRTMYDRIKEIDREKEPRLRADPMAARNDSVYRKLVQEQNQLKETYNARMAQLFREQPELARRNIVDIPSLQARIAEAQTRWQSEGQHRYPQATAERDRACAK